MKILVAYGTRPEWLKIKPLIMKFLEYGIEFECLFTGQHKDIVEYNCKYTINISDCNNNRLNNLIGTILKEEIKWDEYDYVLVQGDTASTFSVALKAFNEKKKIIYLEAGLRTSNLEHPFPEEGYRQMISRITDINLCPTKHSFNNLKNENVTGQCYVVGNTILDNLVNLKKVTDYSNIVLVTLHRRENHEIIKSWFKYLNEAARINKHLSFVFSVHPNPNIYENVNLLTYLKCVRPIEHNLLLKIMANSKFIITDSGGIQEEGTFLNKKIIVCRKHTERQEGIDSGHIVMCKTPSDLILKINEMNNHFQIDSECPFGEGNSSQNICDILIKKNQLKNIKYKKIFTQEIKKFNEFFTKRKNFSFSRFSDGELFILQNKELQLSGDFWKLEDKKYEGTYTSEERKSFIPSEHSDFRNHLIESYIYDNEDYYRGISCRCCVGEDNYASGLFYLQANEIEFQKVITGNKNNLTWANLFINYNYKYYMENILPKFLNYDVYIIVNENAELNMLPFYGNIKEVFRIGSNCLINNLNLKDEIPHYINKNKIKNSLFLFSASSLSNVVIHHCYLANPENIYFDIGSTLNPLMKGMEGWKYNRDYLKNYWMNGKSQIGERICVW